MVLNHREYQNYHETKTHTSVEFPYNTYLCSIPRDFTQVPLHWHDEMELIVIQKGSGCVSVDFRSETVFAGDIVIILPGQLHSISQKESQPMEYENILFRPSMLISGAHDLCAENYILPLIHAQLSPDTFLTPECSYYSESSACIREIDRLCASQPNGYQLAVKGWLFQFLFYLICHQKEQPSFSRAQEKHLKKMKCILTYMEEHFSEPISIEEMANLIYYSKSHFMKFFKTYTGKGFTEYLNDYRLNHAAQLLSTSDLPLIEIAASSGFENLSYFTRIFKREYGITPGKYRAVKQQKTNG